VSDVPPEAAASHEPEPAVHVSAVPRAAPLGAIFGGIGLLAAAVVGLLGLDRVPVTFCVFKGLSGLPCPTCGSTRAVARLFDLDPAGALAMNPFTTVAAVVIAAWAVVDVLLLPRRRALRVGLSGSLGRAFRIAAFAAFVANWVYLIAAGR
jgi:hypothetical protein